MSGPRVLVTYASRHGATRELAEALARDLVASDAGREVGLYAAAVAAESRPDPSSWDAVVLGSAVYAGRWLPAARDLATQRAGALRRRPVWLFSSGPIGDPPYPTDEAQDAPAIAALVAPRGHRVFPGRLDKALLGFAERAVVTAMRAPLGDFRDWDAVRAWAGEIAGAVAVSSAAAAAEPLVTPDVS
ncbi:flavodoxin domain-containing protein [Geodermatophilus aquaeductus]|uniref:Menaquinone-dependent protoporphyrinogen oxidase n=1 Tax=Geodermatophilus aquaeductus TaxID=1564161 RepID=A0A521EBH7_9ACTN|nr:flavodoxin domain-containing protein [Geodermatophilus aquaeductus]SMO81239.1 menaquinone-dependent protoporphyrinogen oxidase [Geodermatophilus aquaeductus]